jgi:hypothetical protein
MGRLRGVVKKMGRISLCECRPQVPEKLDFPNTVLEEKHPSVVMPTLSSKT